MAARSHTAVERVRRITESRTARVPHHVLWCGSSRCSQHLRPGEEVAGGDLVIARRQPSPQCRRTLVSPDIPWLPVMLLQRGHPHRHNNPPPGSGPQVCTRCPPRSKTWRGLNTVALLAAAVCGAEGVGSGTRDIAALVADRGLVFAVAGDMGFLLRIWFMSLIVEKDH
jgi:hypothetical protein